MERSDQTPRARVGAGRRGITTTPSKPRVRNPYQKSPANNNVALQHHAMAASTPPTLPRGSSTPRTTPVNPYAKSTSYVSRATAVDKEAREGAKRHLEALDFSREEGGDEARPSKKVSPTRPPNQNSESSTEVNTRNQPKELPSIDKSKIYTLYFDGGSRGNPGIAGAGMVIYDQKGNEIWNGKHYVGDNETNNVAEYNGLISGLECAHRMGIEKIHARGDSDLVVKQVSGIWQCKKNHLKVLLQKVLDAREKFTEFDITHVTRDHNSRADQLANAAMNSKTTDLGIMDASFKTPELSQESNSETNLKLTGTFDDEFLDEELRSLKVPFVIDDREEKDQFIGRTTALLDHNSATDDINFDEDDSVIMECIHAAGNADDVQEISDRDCQSELEEDLILFLRSNSCSIQHESGWLSRLPFLARFEIERFGLQHNQSLKDVVDSTTDFGDVISAIYNSSDPENTSAVPLYEPFLKHCLSKGFQVDKGKSCLFVFDAELSANGVKLLPPKKADVKTTRLHRCFGSHRFLNLHLNEYCNLPTVKGYMKSFFTPDDKLFIAGRQYAIFHANFSESPVTFRLFAESGSGINKSEELSVSEFVTSCIPPLLNPNLSVSKYMKRMKLSFTSTVPSLVLQLGELEAIPDIHGVDGCMTDGCGLISRDALNKVWKEYISNDEERCRTLGKDFIRETNLFCPYSSFQGRIGGIKGMFVLDPSLKGIKVQYRHSQVSSLYI